MANGLDHDRDRGEPRCQSELYGVKCEHGRYRPHHTHHGHPADLHKYRVLEWKQGEGRLDADGRPL